MRVALLTGRQTGQGTRSARSRPRLRRHPGGGRHARAVPGRRRVPRLALVIVDEQHRFGVHQRLQLREKGLADGRYPHQLVMTATPIPRTLAMTAYADLDVSIIDELPPGRTPIKTVVLPDTRRERNRRAHRRGLPRGPAGVLGLPADRGVGGRALPGGGGDRRRSSPRPCPDVRIGLVHGRMPRRQKDAVMTSFKAGQARPAGRHDGDRGRRRRAEREPDGHRERRAHGPRAAAPAARPRRPRLGRKHLRAAVPGAAVADRARTARRAARDQRRLRGRAARPRTARSRASCSARARPA